MQEQVILLISTTALLLGSPGPVPISLAINGMCFGVRESLGYLFGILTGLVWVMLSTSVGLALVIETMPHVSRALQYLAFAYLMYVAYKIAKAPLPMPKEQLTSKEQTGDPHPGFLDGFTLNLINPKAYAAMLAIFSSVSLSLESQVTSMTYTATTCLLVAIVVDSAWLVLGGLAKPWFSRVVVDSPERAMRIKQLFAFSLVLVVVYSVVI
ncbi:LysE family translocator [Shewanella sp. WXL01]|uniref:LysE family translocator n=1 Tax=Shewanella sp. WXL01 TaxID=2709721 RepID=UPI00143842B5|nr:LysE family translocator [Shewanella sp. WXL01]NKF52567.1 LysE family translocator [Shewanella sp. WXL01]